MTNQNRKLGILKFDKLLNKFKSKLQINVDSKSSPDSSIPPSKENFSSVSLTSHQKMVIFCEEQKKKKKLY